MTPRARSERRCLRRIVATTDVHSALDHAPLLASHLHALRGGVLIAGLCNAARYPLSQTVRRLADLSDQIT